MKKGHKIKIVSRAKENTKRILKDNGFSSEYVPYYKSIVGKAIGVPTNDLRLYKIARDFKPDIFLSPGSPYSAHVSRILGKPHYAFIDTEIASLATKLMSPFTDRIYTSSSFYIDLGPKQIRFNGYYELAYLHPKYFSPDKKIIEEYGLEEGYIILRLSALSSHHDINARGFSFKSEKELNDFINVLEKYGRVIITSEKNNWETISKYQLNFQSKDLHHILYFAKVYIGEGASMASEAAILGIPSIYVSNTRRGYLNELEEKYQLAYSISTREEALNKAIEILERSSVRDEWHVKRDQMLCEKIDVVEYIVDSIENH
jgi:predicted glycosyltransferase